MTDINLARVIVEHIVNEWCENTEPTGRHSERIVQRRIDAERKRETRDRKQAALARMGITERVKTPLGWACPEHEFFADCTRSGHSIRG